MQGNLLEKLEAIGGLGSLHSLLDSRGISFSSLEPGFPIYKWETNIFAFYFSSSRNLSVNVLLLQGNQYASCKHPHFPLCSLTARQGEKPVFSFLFVSYNSK